MTSTVAAPVEIKVGSFVMVEFPRLDKYDTLDRNDAAIRESSCLERCKVKRVIEVDLADWCEITRDLLGDRDLWGKIGGSELSPLDKEAFCILCERHGVDSEGTDWIYVPEALEWFRAHSYAVVVVLLCQGQKPLAVNTEGHTYARSVGRIIG